MPWSSNKKKQVQLTLTNHIPSVLYTLPNACEQSYWLYVWYRSTALLKILSSLTALAIPKRKEFEGKGNSNHTETGGHQIRAKWSRATFTLPNSPSGFETSYENLLSHHPLLRMGRQRGGLIHASQDLRGLLWIRVAGTQKEPGWPAYTGLPIFRWLILGQINLTLMADWVILPTTVSKVKWELSKYIPCCLGQPDHSHSGKVVVACRQADHLQ